MHAIFFISLMVLLVSLVLFTGLKARITGGDFKGVIPINPFLFFIGKVSAFGSWAFGFYRAVTINTASNFSVLWWISWPATIMLVMAVLLVYASFLSLGKDNKFGLPGGKTTLRSKGIYSISRNPMYLGFALINISSALYYPHPANILFGIISMMVHHRILLAEEAFLEKSFASNWHQYAQKTGRYITLPWMQH